MIIAKSWEEDFLAAIGAPTSGKKPTFSEISLCTYCNLSADTRNHRDEIYTDTILAVLREKEPVSSTDLIDEVLHLLGSNPGQYQLVDKQIRTLLTKKKIILKKEDKTLKLSSESHKTIEQTERLYAHDWTLLKENLIETLKAHAVELTESNAEAFAVALARWFVKSQMDGLRDAGVELLQGTWAASLSGGDQPLREMLQSFGVKPRKFRRVMSEVVENAKGAPVLSKLIRTAVFAALEGRDPLLSARALGAMGWSDIRILLDTSVAIPFLCAALTEPVNEYIYGLSSEGVRTLTGLGAKCCISTGHLEECASHLVLAQRYDELGEDPDFVKPLTNSKNAFVAFYFSLLSENKSCPASLRDFLHIFSSLSAIPRGASWSQVLRMVTADLREHLNRYSLEATTPLRVAKVRYQELERRHDQLLESRIKTYRLRAHDLDALAHLEVKREAAEHVWMMLTWDKHLMKVAHAELKHSWVISPEVAMDFSQPCRRLSDSQWCALAHNLARTASPDHALTSRIIDSVAHLASENLKDWQFLESIKTFSEEAKRRLPDPLSESYHSSIEKETNDFLVSNNIVVPKIEPSVETPQSELDTFG